jgi:heptosyltransferase-2
MGILIVKLGAIGDVLRTTTILKGLQEKYPSNPIDWLTVHSSKEVLINNPLINRVFTWEERGGLGGYDLVIGLEDEFEACRLVSSVKSKNILGSYSWEGQITYTPSVWFDMSAISKYGLEAANARKKRNRKTFQQHMADLLGIKVGAYVFNLTQDEVERGDKFVRGLGIDKVEKVVGINTGAGRRWQLKSLSAEKTIDLVKRIKKELGLASLILGGEEERERNEIICRETGMPNGGLHTLRNFAAVVNQCQLLVSSDSLAMHFGIALGRRVVAFFGPTSPFEIELYGLGMKVFSDMDCLVCYKKACEKKPNCMDALPLEDLFQAIKKEAAKI